MLLREYKMILVSVNRPEEMESLRASRKGKVQAGIANVGGGTADVYQSRSLADEIRSREMCG